MRHLPPGTAPGFQGPGGPGVGEKALGAVAAVRYIRSPGGRLLSGHPGRPDKACPGPGDQRFLRRLHRGGGLLRGLHRPGNGGAHPDSPQRGPGGGGPVHRRPGRHRHRTVCPGGPHPPPPYRRGSGKRGAGPASGDAHRRPPVPKRKPEAGGGPAVLRRGGHDLSRPGRHYPV